MTVPRLSRVMAYGMVMLELASLVIQCFGFHHAYSSCTVSFYPGMSDAIAKDFRMCYLLQSRTVLMFHGNNVRIGEPPEPATLLSSR